MPWPDDAPVFGTHAFTAWLVGGVGGGLATALLVTSRFAGRRWGRGLALVAAVGCAALAIATIVFRPTSYPGEAPVPLPVTNLVGLGLGVIAGLYAAFRRRVPAPPGKRGRTAIAAAVLAEAVALGLPTILETHAEYQAQSFPPFTIELVTVYPYNELQPDAETLEHDGERWMVYRSERVVIRDRDVERIRWFDTDDGAAIQIRLGARAAEQVRERSRRRFGLNDALYVDGVLHSVPRYNTIITDRFRLHDTDRLAQHALYDALVR